MAETFKVLIITSAPSMDRDHELYRFAQELAGKGLEPDLCTGLLPEDPLPAKYFPGLEVFNSVYRRLDGQNSERSYKAVIFYGSESAPACFQQAKSLFDCPVILYGNCPENKQQFFNFALSSKNREDIIEYICSGYIPDKKLTSVIMLTFNQLHLTKQTLDSLNEFTTLPYELIIVDNGSNDGTRDFLSGLEKKDDSITCIFNEENLGFAKANNQGIKKAQGEYILLLNNDVILTQDWLSKLVLCADSIAGAGIAGPCTNIASGPQKTVPGYDDVNKLQIFAAGFAAKNAGTWIDCHRLNAFCMLIKKEVISRVGVLDERFGPGGFEDYDYCLRVRQAGYKIMLAADTYVHHIGGQGYAPNRLDYDELRTVNKQIFIDKWCRRALEIMESLPDG